MRWTPPVQTFLWIAGLSLLPWSLAISEDEVEITRIGINDSTVRIQAEINQACGSEASAPLDYGFRCPQGASAVSALSRGVSRSNLSLSARQLC